MVQTVPKLKVMNILTGTQMRELDNYTIEHEPISSIDLMERAAKAVAEAIAEEWAGTFPVVVFAGPGNNGGDALAVARLLADRGYRVDTYLFNIGNHLSDDCSANKDRLSDCLHKGVFNEITHDFDPPKLTPDTIVVDGLFGSGLDRPLAGGFASLVNYINQSPAHVVSIDIPSGMAAEDNPADARASIVKAEITLTLHQKKLSMMLPDMQKYLGKVRVLDIGLDCQFAANMSCRYTTLDEQYVKRQMLARDDFAHKGDMGNALLVAGSYGMAGASVLAARACLRSGVGKLSALTPKCNYDIMQMSVPEAVVLPDRENYFSEAVPADRYDAIGIGPGLGQEEYSALAVMSQVQQAQCPVVLDADALNILGAHSAWLGQLPEGVIMTPHPREFDRLAGMPIRSAYDRLAAAINMAVSLKAYIMLKGHYTALCLPDGSVIFNTTGNSGMATAGAGDVLTGLLTGLLARGYNRKHACITAMYAHGLAGDIAASCVGKESLTASDIIACLPDALKKLYE